MAIGDIYLLLISPFATMFSHADLVDVVMSLTLSITHNWYCNTINTCITIFLLINAPGAMQNIDWEPLFCTKFA